jgi:hypothetical protein
MNSQKLEKYLSDEDFEISSRNLASLLYILGYGKEEFDDLTIDNLVNLIRDRYVYKHSFTENSASQAYIKKQNIVLARAVRRSWFDVQFASHEALENG